MVRERVQKSSTRSPQQQESAIAPVVAQSHSPSSHTQPDMEAEEMRQHKHEATILKIQAKYGTITPQGQERLTFLQAKMADYTQRKLDFGHRVYQQMFNSSGDDVSVTPPQRKTASPIQAKLTIGQPGDKYEQEADRVAAQIVNLLHAPDAQRQEMLEKDEQQKKPAIGSIQRETMPDEDEELQMKSSGAGMTASQDLETSIQQVRGSGQSLADSIREPMEQAFGADFSRVKVHVDAQSHQLNQSIQARAFTTGQDIFFRQGEYNPGSRGGQELIAHELTHVVQQNGSAVQRQLEEHNKQAEPVVHTAAKLPVSVKKATIANVVHRALDAKQKVKVEQIARDWAATIKKKNDQKSYNKDKIKYIKNKLKSGDLVEEVGSSRVQDKFDAPEVTVWSNMRLEFQDANGKSVGGEQAELDFFIFNEGGGNLPDPVKVVSAKLDGQKVRPSQDRSLLRHYYELNITGTEQELIDDLKARFGGSPKYQQARRVVVRYVNNADGHPGLLPLEEFRRRVPTPPGNAENVKVYGIAPDDTIKGKQNFIQLGIDQQPLLDRVIQIIDNNI